MSARFKRWTINNSHGGAILEDGGHRREGVEFSPRASFVSPFLAARFPAPHWVRGGDQAPQDEAELRGFYDAVASARSFGEFSALRMMGLPTSAWELFLPHWLLLLAAAVTWGLLIGWRLLRRRKPD